MLGPPLRSGGWRRSPPSAPSDTGLRRAPAHPPAPRDVTSDSPGRAHHGARPQAAGAAIRSRRAAAAVSIPAQNRTRRSPPRRASPPISARLPEAAPACWEERACAHTPSPGARRSGSCRPRPRGWIAAALSSRRRFGTDPSTESKSSNTPPTL